MQGEARQAREFGYAVSSGPAREIAGGADYTDLLTREAAQVEVNGEKEADRAMGCAAVFLIGMGVMLFFTLPEFPPVVPLFLAVCLMLAGAFFRWQARREGVKHKERYAAQIEALGRPWQVWPCRIEEAPDIVPHANSEILGTLIARAQAGRTTTVTTSGIGDTVNIWKVHRVFLLAPDGTPAKTFAAFLPDAVWQGMVDGLGPLWVCGDLRHRVVMATPGAGQAWIAVPSTPPTVDSPRPSGGLIEDIARDAGREALLNWFT